MDIPPVQPHPALAALPRGLFLMTAAYEGKRAGVLVNSVQVCAESPPLLSVAMRKGHFVETLIRDAHTFAVCLMRPEDKLIARKFTDVPRREPLDPFDCFPCERLATGAPVVRRSIAAFDCEVVRHIDIEADYELYIGLVLASRMYVEGSPKP